MALIFSMHSVHWLMGEGKGRKKQGKKENRLHWSLMKRLFLSALRWKERKIHSPHARCDCLSTFALPVLHKGFSSSTEREWGQNKRQQQHKSLISTCLAMQTNTVAKELTETKAHSNARRCLRVTSPSFLCFPLKLSPRKPKSDWYFCLPRCFLRWRNIYSASTVDKRWGKKCMGHNLQRVKQISSVACFMQNVAAGMWQSLKIRWRLHCRAVS